VLASFRGSKLAGAWCWPEYSSRRRLYIVRLRLIVGTSCRYPAISTAGSHSEDQWVVSAWLLAVVVGFICELP
jgi:hypothetical protein